MRKKIINTVGGTLASIGVGTFIGVLIYAAFLLHWVIGILLIALIFAISGTIILEEMGTD